MIIAVLLALAAPPEVARLFPAGGQRGTKATVVAEGKLAHWPAKAWVSGKGVTAVPGKAKGEFAVSIAADAAPGLRWLRVHDREGGSNLRPFLVGTLPEVADVEPNDEPRRAQRLAGPGVVANGRLQKAGDVDCFAMEAKKGQTLVAHVEANRILKSPMDAVLQVLTPEGILLEQNHDRHGLDPQLEYAVPKDGLYVLRVFAFPSLPTGTIGFAGGEAYVYRLTATTAGWADHALPLAVPRSSRGKARLVGWNLPAAALAADVPEDGELTVPGMGNTAVVRVEPHDTHDDTAPGAKMPDLLAPPFTVTGRSAASYRFAGKKGQPLAIRAEAQALGFPLVPVLRVLDGEGKQLARAEPALGADPELAFSPPLDGSYRVEVRDLHGEGGPRHLFRLRVVRPVPDFALSTANDRFFLVPGKPLEVAVQVTRRNGFAGKLELAAEGLPAGVTAKVVRQDAKSVTVALLATGGASGAFRLVGRAAGLPERAAEAPDKLLGLSSSDLWLTAAPPRK